MELISSCKNGDIETVKTLINGNINVTGARDSKDGFGYLVMLASEKGHIEIVKLLLKKGANTKAKDIVIFIHFYYNFYLILTIVKL